MAVPKVDKTTTIREQQLAESNTDEKDYDPKNDTEVFNTSCITNGMASVGKVPDDNFIVQYGLMITTHSYTGYQAILDGRQRYPRRARAGVVNIIPTTTGAAKTVAAVLPKYKGKLNFIALRAHTPNVSIVDLLVKTCKNADKQAVNAAPKTAADGPRKGIINFVTQPLVITLRVPRPNVALKAATDVPTKGIINFGTHHRGSSDFKQTDYSNFEDAALTMVMGGVLVKVLMRYANK
jgi:glyceraldehyde-3-phosphate dehydrogenase/erythrose-4-phosphate dehydrogenase